MRKWELVIVWESGETDIFKYNSEAEALAGENNYRMAFGNQISFCCVRTRIETITDKPIIANITISSDESLIAKNGWDFPIEELGYLLEEHAGETFVLKGGRLYETEV